MARSTRPNVFAQLDVDYDPQTGNVTVTQIYLPAPHGLNEIGHQGLFHDEGVDLIYNRARQLHPTLGRFMQRDPLGYVDGMSVYEYVKSTPFTSNDFSGLVTVEQINAIAKQMGLDPVESIRGPFTDLIKAIQRRIGTQDDGFFGPTSVVEYEDWARKNSLKPIKLRDPQKAKRRLELDYI